jgi:hypothetical protein
MRRLWLVPLCFAALLVPAAVLAGSGGGGFDDVVHSIENRYGVRATRIPFMGLISIIASRSTHSGVSNIHVAEFDRFSATVDGDELNHMVVERLGSGWERIIRETSHNGGEQTLIFIHPEGERMGLFVVDSEKNEMDVVQVSVDPKHLDDDIGHYRHHHGDQDYSKDDGNGSGDSN